MSTTYKEIFLELTQFVLHSSKAMLIKEKSFFGSF